MGGGDPLFICNDEITSVAVIHYMRSECLAPPIDLRQRFD